MSVLCWLCNNNTLSKIVQLRSKKEAIIQYCSSCHFEFFSHENKDLLAANMLDNTRLQSAGLEIPKQEKDFENGYNQSKSYIQEYLEIDDVGANILDIGCSWGYFLKAVQEFGAIPYGIEINPIRSKYVVEKLNIKCEHGLENYETIKIKFKKIFSFYCLEYIKNPVDFFKKLINLLDDKGKIIFITPNLDDVLKDIWENKGYQDFFYDECAIAYYSFKAVQCLLQALKTEKSSFVCTINTHQGYSIFNHIHWYFNNRPLSNNSLVGADCLAKSFENIFAGKDKNHFINKEFADMVYKFNENYKQIIESNNLGNQIIIKIQKSL